ncbi:hypothetical protein PHYBOEH_001997 [Phytophthora boehmeriae]|uniref:F-box domain-containing protein n=1 Tax=Phytophthora boehmeriae TaxID=109152 RepID=A0A8T1WXT6_9STRA|nr:hypothetical protein PHYBOEH_001997 [Phytophthora boehmeriae]
MAPLSLPALPLALSSLIVEFAVYDFTQDLTPEARSVPKRFLKNLALVSKSWHHLIEVLMAQIEVETMRLNAGSCSRSELLDVRSAAQSRGRQVRDLRLTVGRPKKYSYGSDEFMLPSAATEKTLVDWDAVFVHLPALKRLDLKLVPLESRQLPAIVEAAAKRCLQLEALILPRKAELKQTTKGSAIEKLMTTLYAALERWYVKGGRGGIRQLTVPTRNDAQRFRSSTKFIEAVTRFCPNIEYLDGSKLVLDSMDSVRCTDKWVISLDTWERLNANCSGLRVFDWTVVPFADPYFRVFSAYPKPQLKELNVCANLWWNWKEYFSAIGDTAASADIKTGKPGYGRRARDVEVVFQGCPNLTSLSVEIDLLKLDGHFDMKVFGDTFWDAAATNCPLLKRMSIENCANYEVTRINAIKTFTDVALLKLAELKYMSSIDIQVPVMCTGYGIFEYLRRAVESGAATGKWRMLSLRVGGRDDAVFGVPSFYFEVVELLKRLSAISEENFGAAASRQKFEVYISNPYTSRVSNTWSATYMRDELKPLMEQVKAMHPGLSINASVIGHVGDSFKCVETIVISWRPEDSNRELFMDIHDDDAEFEESGFIDPTELSIVGGGMNHRPGREGHNEHPFDFLGSLLHHDAANNFETDSDDDD